MLVNKGVLGQPYNKTEISRIAKDELLRAAGADIEAPINVQDVYSRLSAVEQKLDSVLRILEGRAIA